MLIIYYCLQIWVFIFFFVWREYYIILNFMHLTQQEGQNVLRSKFIVSF